MTDILEKIRKSEKNLFVGLAGPGTGKSYTFKTIIESDEYKGKKILILSFINKLIDDLSQEFKDFKNVEVSTLHAFAKKKIGDVDFDSNLDCVISEDYFFIKKDNINYEERFHENNLTEDELNFYKERILFYKYGERLYSFNSIIYLINLIFSEQESCIPKYDLILIDEFQDFNKSEYELIKLLNKKNKVVLVGDDDQSLYDWKNAKPEQIRNLYSDVSTEEFSLDYCFRCTEVIVNTTNDLIRNSKGAGYLEDRLDKKFLYPNSIKEKNKISEKYPKIDFIPSVPCGGHLLIYQLSEAIKKDIEKGVKKKILVLVPSYLKQTIYEGLIKKGFNVINFELFSEEKCNKIKHKNLVEIFEILFERKTDNLSLRKVLFLYFSSEDKVKNIIIQSNQEKKGIWSCLEKDIKENIEEDIKIFKKVKSGRDKLNNKELKRFSEIFNLKNILSKMINGFDSIKKDATEIEITTVMSSKGLSMDFVYYVGINDKIILDRETSDFTDQKICEFLVGITRAKEKLTLISLEDENPKILEFIDKKYINKIKQK
ncbi:MAG: ATP-dependent helicase [Candidatus Pacebacteria bacterium]|nr:ATP-dependent helicase [Candidatus Paceibacterota bacterium]